MTKEAVLLAIKNIEECRESHVLWSDFIRRNPEGAQESKPTIEIAGNAEFHDEWIVKYDHVLSVLNGILNAYS